MLLERLLNEADKKIRNNGRKLCPSVSSSITWADGALRDNKQWLAACQMARRTFLIINCLFKETSISSGYTDWKPIPVSARINAWVCGLSFPKGCGFDSRLGHGCLSAVSFVCCQIGWSLVQGSPTACSLSRCDRETSTIKKPWPTTDCRARKMKTYTLKY
jgi:hypothetical protein